MITRPLTVECLLEGLSPATPFRDAIIGDLAEEFRERAEQDGPNAARRWYYRESIRVAPHLFYEWVRGLRRSDLGHIANTLLPAWIFSLTTLFFVILTGTSILSALGYTMKAAAHAPLSYVTTAIGLIATMVGAVVGGTFAARLDRQTPFASAVALGTLWSVAHFSLSFVDPHGVSASRLGTEVVIVLGAVIGGALYMHAVRFEPREGAS